MNNLKTVNDNAGVAPVQVDQKIIDLVKLGKDSFQEIDITGVTMPITKYNFIVKDVKRLATVIIRRNNGRNTKSGMRRFCTGIPAQSYITHNG